MKTVAFVNNMLVFVKKYNSNSSITYYAGFVNCLVLLSKKTNKQFFMHLNVFLIFYCSSIKFLLLTEK